ncbi:hypothetical protein CXK86_03695 [Paenibacillus sp. BGI2013]|uniref:hypothetical protein n=1 Tax=Paenibacillus TaxID=44249 RepID=UPI00096C9884|nr:MULTISPECIES: hypothetical protein [Paenibacillus]OMF47831.1 hypothetical protein BK136_02770 [Paenibacillus amylolyticus]PKQ93220.1 hypothetical protein CXK86_03695 [Paenibacillus sp. BGI2013]
MKIIRDREELEGTGYIEVLPGKYLGQCWNEDSIYFDEEVFGFVEKTIENIFSGYDHYAFNEIHRKTWEVILEDLKTLANLLDEKVTMELINEHVYFFFGSSKDEFQQDFLNSVQRLRELIIEFVVWIKKQLTTHDYVSVLGI